MAKACSLLPLGSRNDPQYPAKLLKYRQDCIDGKKACKNIRCFEIDTLDDEELKVCTFVPRDRLSIAKPILVLVLVVHPDTILVVTRVLYVSGGCYLVQEMAHALAGLFIRYIRIFHSHLELIPLPSTRYITRQKFPR